MHPLEILLTPLGRALRRRRADETASIAHARALDSAPRIALSSPAFADGGEIPATHCGWLIGEDVSPALSWSELPAGTVEALLVLEDLDSPGTMPRIHTIAAFPPGGHGLAQGALGPDAPGVRFLARGRRPGRYAGPRPLPGHGPHRYRFHLYALDCRIDLDALSSPERLPAAVDGHVLAAGTLTGTRTS